MEQKFETHNYQVKNQQPMKLTGEYQYFTAEVQRLINKSNIRLKKAFDIRRHFLKIKRTKQLDLMNEQEIDTLKRCQAFIKKELAMRKQHQKKQDKYKFINN